jgi:hypothetical protein
MIANERIRRNSKLTRAWSGGQEKNDTEDIVSDGVRRKKEPHRIVTRWGRNMLQDAVS